MIRQTLDPDAPLRYTATDLTSLQYREAAGDVTKEVRSDLKAPVRIRIERHANQFTMAAGNPAEELKRFGPVTINLQDPVYVGLAVGSHNADALETAVFSNVTVQQSADQKPAPIKTSHISVYDLRSKSVNLLFSADQMIEAPTYSPDGKYLLVNSKGDLWKLPIGSGTAELHKLELGSISRCNNDKGISPDGKLIAFSSSAEGHGSQVYLVIRLAVNPPGHLPSFLGGRQPST